MQPCGGIRGQYGCVDHQVQMGIVCGCQAVLFHVEVADVGVAKQALAGG